MNKSIVASSLLLLALAGCSNKESQLEGKWKFKDLSTPSSQNPQAAQSIKNMLGSMSLEFKKDKTYAMTVGVAMEGNWTLSGNTVSMKPTKVMGMDIATVKKQAAASGKMTTQQSDQIDKGMTATLSDDGKTLTMAGNGGASGGGSMTLTKDTSS